MVESPDEYNDDPMTVAALIEKLQALPHQEWFVYTVDRGFSVCGIIEQRSFIAPGVPNPNHDWEYVLV